MSRFTEERFLHLFVGVDQANDGFRMHFSDGAFKFARGADAIAVEDAVDDGL